MHRLGSLDLAVALLGALVAALPWYLWTERRYRSAWFPVAGAPVAIRRGSYRDTTVLPLAVGRAPRGIRWAAYACFVVALLAAGVLVRALEHASQLHLRWPSEWLAALSVLAVPTLGAAVALALLRAGIATLRRDTDAAARVRRGGVAAVVFAVAQLALALALARWAHFGRAALVVHGLATATVALAHAALALRAAGWFARAHAAGAPAADAPLASG